MGGKEFKNKRKAKAGVSMNIGEIALGLSINQQSFNNQIKAYLGGRYSSKNASVEWKKNR